MPRQGSRRDRDREDRELYEQLRDRFEPRNRRRDRDDDDRPRRNRRDQDDDDSPVLMFSGKRADSLISRLFGDDAPELDDDDQDDDDQDDDDQDDDDQDDDDQDDDGDPEPPSGHGFFRSRGRRG